MASDADVQRAVAAAERSAVAAEAAADAARAAAAEATVTLAQLATQAGTRLDVLDEAVQGMTATRSLLGQVLEKVDAMATVDDVRNSMRVTTADQAQRRRLAAIRLALAVFWLVIGSVVLVSQHVEHCSPGAKANRVAEQLLQDDPSLDGLRDAARQPTPTWCDVTVPTIAHPPLTDWPTDDNLVGLALYVTAAVATVVAVRRRAWERSTPELPRGVPSAP